LAKQVLQDAMDDKFISELVTLVLLQYLLNQWQLPVGMVI